MLWDSGQTSTSKNSKDPFRVVKTFCIFDYSGVYPVIHICQNSLNCTHKMYITLHINYVCACILSCFSPVQFFVTPQTEAHQGALSMGFSRQEYCSGLPFSSPMHSCMLSRFCFIDYAKAFDCVDHNKLENSTKDRNTRLP